MFNQSEFVEFRADFEKYVRPKYYPLAVKLLKEEKEIPDESIRPKADLECRLSVCQAYGISRRRGDVISMLKEDMWCPEPIICYGLVKPPDYFLKGHMNLNEGYEGQYLKNLEAAERYAASLPRFEAGKYIGVVSAPMMRASFIPDLILVYCNSAQITQLVSAVAYSSGQPIASTIGGGACIRSVVPAIKSREFQISVPCGGDRRWGLTQDDDMIFSIPKEKMKVLLEGLKGIGHRDPVDFVVRPTHELPPGYFHTLEILGLA
jgi:uncharacterized protein (DUF169 family)